MEVKIVITDATSVAGAQGATSVQVTSGAAGQTTQVAAVPTAPPEVLAAAAATGALDAGPAPNLMSMGTAGAPALFIGEGSGSPSAAMESMAFPAQAAGAAPGSGAQMEVHTIAEGGGES